MTGDEELRALGREAAQPGAVLARQRLDAARARRGLKSRPFQTDEEIELDHFISFMYAPLSEWVVRLSNARAASGRSMWIPDETMARSPGPWPWSSPRNGLRPED